ncbi:MULTISPECIES: TetR family transcriptional regulator [unclassified Streptomyces]|uniref:TetR/AcrR family transcriptional regulator n=1 Tax=unclassified Streptomyces TaxID=2593676 RepID=UPI002DD852A5|nr:MULTISPECIES: TetR family transcriptional regulator [unclassified Streptomyces]WSA93124.1 TetR family transcriptional regulator [Streptomyces sp. NBC_01795]WSB77495.1 TetR family transcriptional regulator [Streptomyces sp. NBC_01775]WSS14240.1 TetR family transcriptional regulator [Streptomyces sp. NBC_01186]WSS43059.1 TetR family transcriptional regulator [Streptomyces sp. NBC_01187]
MDGTETRTEAPEPARRSDSTRAAILRAARDSFAAEGYERATIRLIAREAGIDPAMVMRYYGNKAGLFAASVEFDLRLPEASYLPREHAGAVLVRHFLSLWEEDEALKAMLRVGATNPAGAEKMRGIFRDQLGPLAEALSPDPDEARTRAGLVASQVLGMALCRYVLELPPVVALPPEEVVRWLAPTVQAYLAGEAPSPPPPEDG